MIAQDAKTVDALARTERLNYFRQWRASNKDRVKKHNENYWKRKAERKLLEQSNPSDQEVNP